MDHAGCAAYLLIEMAEENSSRVQSARSNGEGAVVFFDGTCAMCSRWASFVAARDPRGRFRFAGLESEEGARLLARHGVDAAAVDTVVLLQGGRIFTRSTAVLRIVRSLRFPWSLLYGLAIIPRPLRDAVYGWIARRRHRLASPS